MQITKKDTDTFIAILEEELIPALGCTEPIAIAYGAATARQILGQLPDSITIQCSGSIIKNVKAVTVPNSGGMRGIIAAACLGVVAGNPQKDLEVLADVRPEQIEETKKFITTCNSQMRLLDTPASLHLIISVSVKDKKNAVETAEVEIIHQHTNIVRKSKNGKVIFEKAYSNKVNNTSLVDRSGLSIKKIIEFANIVDLHNLKKVLERQIDYNTRIVEAGLKGDYGLNIGSNLLEIAKEHHNNDILVQAKAQTAAGSDARMSGCTLPVVTNSGSGNQGLTASIPVIVYAKKLEISHENLLRSLIVSNLTAIHQKTRIGRLSAYCGTVNAATGSAAGIAYMNHGTYKQICDTITNTLATISGLLCDGAKPSCASKIASAVECAITGYRMAMKDRVFSAGDGIVKDDIEKTIAGIGKIAAIGMIQTDKVILDVVAND